MYNIYTVLTYILAHEYVHVYAHTQPKVHANRTQVSAQMQIMCMYIRTYMYACNGTHIHLYGTHIHTYIPLRVAGDICLLRCLLWSCQWHRKRAPFSASEEREEGTSCDTGQPAGKYHKTVWLTWQACPSFVSFPFRDEFSD